MRREQPLALAQVQPVGEQPAPVVAHLQLVHQRDVQERPQGISRETGICRRGFLIGRGARRKEMVGRRQAEDLRIGGAQFLLQAAVLGPARARGERFCFRFGGNCYGAVGDVKKRWSVENNCLGYRARNNS